MCLLVAGLVAGRQCWVPFDEIAAGHTTTQEKEREKSRADRRY